MSAYITFDNIAKHYHSADVVTRVPGRCQLYRRAGRACGHPGTIGCRQDDGIEYSGRYGYRYQWKTACGWQRYHRLQSQTAGGIPAL